MTARALLLPAALFLLLAPAPRAQDAGEAALWKLWQAVERNPTNAMANARLCAQFEQAPEAAALKPVARGLLGWHLLAAGKTMEGTKAFESQLAKDPAPLAAAANDMASRWLTRLDREKVKAGLELVYKRELEYPATIDTLAKLDPAARPPLTDRFGNPWDYRREGMKHIKGLMGQRYLLRSSRLTETSDLATELAKPYASGLRITLEKDAGGESGMLILTAASGEKLALAPGQSRGRITLAHAGRDIVVVSDGDCWRVLPRR